MRELNGWMTEINFSPDEHIWWGEVIGLRGESVHTTISIPSQDSEIATKRRVAEELAKYTETHPAPDYLEYYKNRKKKK